MHWDALEKVNVEGTIWDRRSRKLSESRNAPHIQRATSVVDVGRILPALEDEFAVNASSSTHKRASSKISKKKDTTVRFFPTDLSRNVSIALRGCLGKRELSGVAQAIKKLDIASLGGIDVVETLTTLGIYEDSMVKEVCQYTGEPSRLDLPERFVYEVVSRVPPVRLRLKVMNFLATYQDIYESVTDRISKLEMAFSEVHASKRLSTLLVDVILPLGNRLNETSKKSHAAGIRLKSLDNILRVKTANGKNFLRFVVDGLLEMDESNPGVVSKLLQVDEDFPELLSVTGTAFEWDSLASAITFLKQGLSSTVELQKLVSSEEDEDVQQYLEESVSSATDSVEHATSSFDELREAFTQLCRYFGEDPSKTNMIDLLGALQNFLRGVQNEYKGALAKRHRQQLSSKTPTEAGKAPTKPSGKPPKVTPAPRTRRATLGGTGAEEPSLEEKAEILNEMNSFFMEKASVEDSSLLDAVEEEDGEDS